MKICYISNSAAPSMNASSLQTSKLCESLKIIGNKVLLILPNTGEKKNFNKFYSIKNKYEIKKIFFFKKFPIGLSYYVYSLFAIFFGIKFNADIFITRNYFACLVLSLLNKKIIIEIHDSPNNEGRIVKFLQKKFFFLNSKNIFKIVVTTKTLRSHLVSHWNVEYSKIQVLHNSSSLNFTFKPSYKKNSYNIGYFGALYGSRGISIINKLSVIDQNNKYYIYGGSKADVQFFKNRNKNVTVNQYIPYAHVEKKLQNIDICVLPYSSKITVAGNVGNIRDYTSPLKIFDYMISGKLIICSDFPVIREVLKNNFNAILIKDTNNLHTWFNIVKKVTLNFKKYERIRWNAYVYGNKKNWINRAKIFLSKNSSC